jgi:hypothetical protein
MSRKPVDMTMGKGRRFPHPFGTDGRFRTMKTTPKLRYARAHAAAVLDISTRTARRYEALGLLTPIKPSGDRGPVYYSADEIEALATAANATAKKGRA